MALAADISALLDDLITVIAKTSDKASHAPVLFVDSITNVQ